MDGNTSVNIMSFQSGNALKDAWKGPGWYSLFWDYTDFYAGDVDKNMSHYFSNMADFLDRYKNAGKGHSIVCFAFFGNGKTPEIYGQC